MNCSWPWRAERILLALMLLTPMLILALLSLQAAMGLRPVGLAQAYHACQAQPAWRGLPSLHASGQHVQQLGLAAVRRKLC